MVQKVVTVSFRGTSTLAQVTAGAGAHSEAHTGLKPCPRATATLDFQRACRSVGWRLDPEQCLSCVIYPSTSLIYFPCLKVSFFTEILHDADVQEVYAEMHVQELYSNVRKQSDF